MAEPLESDVIIVGGGIVGAACAWALASTLRVTLVEQESLFGFHSTGRSAALYTEYFGDPVTRALTRASRDFFHHPRGAGFPQLLRPRGTLVLITRDDRENGTLERLLALATPDLPVRSLSLDAAMSLCPILDPADYASALLREKTWDIDVEALYQGMLRAARRGGATLLSGVRIREISDSGGGWNVEGEAGGAQLKLKARILVNAAGAWGDELARKAGVAPLGLVPRRRSVVYVEDGQIARDAGRTVWPMVNDTADTFYFKPENNGLIVSPCDETPCEPADAQPEELDVAQAVSRLERVTRLEVKRIASRWAGLRTFAGDGGPVVGPAADHDRFFWVVGQGGTGIQTAPATGRALAGLVLDAALPADLRRAGIEQAALGPSRLRNAARTEDHGPGWKKDR